MTQICKIGNIDGKPFFGKGKGPKSAQPATWHINFPRVLPFRGGWSFDLIAILYVESALLLTLPILPIRPFSLWLARYFMKSAAKPQYECDLGRIAVSTWVSLPATGPEYLVFSIGKELSMLKRALVLSLILTALLSLSGVGDEGSGTAEAKEIPTLSFAYGTDTHTCLPNVAMKDPNAFANKAMRVRPVSDTQFELLKDGKVIALFNLLVSKSGAESATMMAQGHLDTVLCSNTAMLSAYDVGTNIKILSPLQGGGVSVIMDPKTDFYGFDAFKKYITNSKSPVKIGYHSATSGPRILIESVLRDAGLKLTEDPADLTANVLMVDLKGPQNLLGSIRSGAVDAWVGPSAHPEYAVDQGLGKIVMTLKDFPPAGKWTTFPCCVMSATAKVIQEHPEVIEALVSVVSDCIDYAISNPKKFAEINSTIIGVKEDVIMASNTNIVYSNDPSKEWEQGIDVYFSAIKSMGKFNGRLKEANYDVVKKEVFNFSFLEKVKAEKINK